MYQYNIYKALMFGVIVIQIVYWVLLQSGCHGGRFYAMYKCARRLFNPCARAVLDTLVGVVLLLLTLLLGLLLLSLGGLGLGLVLLATVLGGLQVVIVTGLLGRLGRGLVALLLLGALLGRGLLLLVLLDLAGGLGLLVLLGVGVHVGCCGGCSGVKGRVCFV